MDRLNLQAGRRWPLGATVRDGGVNFAVFSAHAQRVELCLFDHTGRQELSRTALPARSGDVFHGFFPCDSQAALELIYGLRAHGPWRPDLGHRFNPNKLSLDPWAREIVGRFGWGSEHFAADRQHPQHMDPRDNAATALKARVVADAFDWQGDQPLHTPLAHSVLYELHVKGFTRQMAAVPEHQRGTYLGLAHPAAIAHLTRLGVTAVSLLPVHQHIDEERLVRLGLSNYWGYNSIGFFCPEPGYATCWCGRTARDEFRTMVRALHAAGIEVLLDVVYNHTPEGDQHGPSISHRGLEHRHAYRLAPGRLSHCENLTGCGNTVDLRHPRMLQLVLDSLRYWVRDMHVDGFRFDLAPILGRGDQGFEREGAFFKALQQDPVLAGAKLIAEPWDIGEGGYQLGNFPRGWLEWNDRFRDTTRAFWLGGDVTRGEFAQRLAGSSSTFQPRGRHPAESVNYVVSHDGFTLRDLLSYEIRRNHANGEDNRDGHGHNLGWNCGAEGPTTDPAVLALRARLQRALLATVLLSQGTPMLAAGDEFGHSQGGNNNPYCQDNTTTWLDWASADQALIDFTAHVINLRQRLLPLANDRWYSGLPDVRGRHDLTWLHRSGQPLQAAQWDNRGSRILAAWIGQPGRSSDALLLLFNARDFDTDFELPPAHSGSWLLELDSSETSGRSSRQAPAAGRFLLPARSVLLLRDARA
jgi:glycogen debranching enzyme